MRTDRHTVDRQTDRQKDRQADRQTDRQKDRQADRQTERKTGRQADETKRIVALRNFGKAFVKYYLPHISLILWFNVMRCIFL